MTTASGVLRCAKWYCTANPSIAEDTARKFYEQAYAISMGEREFLMHYAHNNASGWCSASAALPFENTPMPFILWTHAINKYRPAWAGYPQEDNNMDT